MHSSIIELYETGIVNNPDEIIENLILCKRKEIGEFVKCLSQKEITTGTIPQYSSFEDGTVNLIKFLRMAGNYGPSFEEVGKHYLNVGHEKRAYIKYGENHSKLGQMLGVVDIKNEGLKRIYLNKLGYALEKRNREEQHECFIKLAGLIPIVQFALKENVKNDKELELLLQQFLSASTALRRRRNTWYLISALRGDEI